MYSVEDSYASLERLSQSFSSIEPEVATESFPSKEGCGLISDIN